MINDTRTEPNQKIRRIMDRRKDHTSFHLRTNEIRNAFGIPVLIDRRKDDRRNGCVNWEAKP